MARWTDNLVKTKAPKIKETLHVKNFLIWAKKKPQSDLCIFGRYKNDASYSPTRKMFIAPSPAYHRPGSPDVWGAWRSWPAFIEFKTTGGRVSPEQTAFIAEATAKGYLAGIVYSFEDGVKLLREWDLAHGVVWRGEWTP